MPKRRLRVLAMHSQGTFMSGSAHESSVEQVPNLLTYKTADLGYDCYAQSGAKGWQCYGHGSCSGGVAMHADCTTCITPGYSRDHRRVSRDQRGGDPAS
ncbi:hypothetical protein NL676_023263 [Syzygium grande]|nr:hypothetical protein NL676_023263 [Syzygium grande]